MNSHNRTFLAIVGISNPKYDFFYVDSERKFELFFQAWQAQPLAAKSIHAALKEDLALRGSAKIGEDTEYKLISDLKITISDDVIEDIKVDVHTIVFIYS